MLLEVAALLIASAPHLAAAEAAAVPAHSIQAPAEHGAEAPRQEVGQHQGVLSGISVLRPDAAALGIALTADPVVRPFLQATPAAVKASPAALAGMSGMPLLAQLALLDRSELGSFAAANPEVLRELLDAQPRSRLVTSWWASLDGAAQRRLLSAVPELVGNLEGVPFAARDQANRAYLADAMEHYRQVIDSEVGRSEASAAQDRLDTLAEITAALDAGSGPERSLLELSLDGEPEAAIALGDLGSADYVGYLVPGMFFGVTQQIGAWTDTAARLYDEQVGWLELFQSATGETAPPAEDRVATIAWIGYQTPSLLNVGSLDLAREGSRALAASIEGLKTLRGTDQPYLAVLAHSYGSTAALLALSDAGVTVDALALVGSPGSPAGSVEELGVRDGNVFVGEAGWDPIPNSAFFGSDPGSKEYGAHRMSVAGGVDRVTERALAASVGHNAYFEAGSESLRNLALIGIDREEFVTEGSAADKERTLALLD